MISKVEVIYFVGMKHTGIYFFISISKFIIQLNIYSVCAVVSATYLLHMLVPPVQLSLFCQSMAHCVSLTLHLFLYVYMWLNFHFQLDFCNINKSANDTRCTDCKPYYKEMNSMFDTMLNDPEANHKVCMDIVDIVSYYHSIVSIHEKTLKYLKNNVYWRSPLHFKLNIYILVIKIGPTIFSVLFICFIHFKYDSFSIQMLRKLRLQSFAQTRLKL